MRVESGRKKEDVRDEELEERLKSLQNLHPN